MTEIPEHLLARSKSRRDAIGQSGDDAGGAAAAAPSSAVEKASSTAPATPAGPEAAGGIAPAKAPSAPAAPAAPPDRPEVAAAKARKKIPYWAAPALVAMPVWAFLYAFTLEPPTKESPVLSAGGEIYGSACGTCHGAAGQGGVGPAFADGAVVETFSDFNDHVEWVHLGSAGWREENGDTYGDADKPVNGYNGQNMPAFAGSLSDEEILEVVRYEREVISGYGCEPLLAEATGEECEPGTENPDAPTEAAAE